MAKKEKEEGKVTVEEEAYRISAQQLYDRSSNRKVLNTCLSADIGLGGGIPMGSTILIGGRPKAGKTTISLQYGADAQKKYNAKVFFFNVEARLSKLVLSQIKGLLLDKDHFEVIMPPAIIDSDGNVIGNKKVGAQWWWTQIGEVLSNNPGSVVIVDSISALSSEREVSEGMGFQGRGDLQKLEAQFCRSFADLVVPSNITLFLLAQIQANTSGYGDPLQIKCGNAIKHSADGIMFARGIEKWKEDSSGRILGHDINFKIECSPMGSPFVETKVPLRYSYGIDNLQDIVNHCINWEIIKKGGAWYTLPFIETDNNVEFHEEMQKDVKYLKFQGENNIRNWLLLHPEQSNILDNLIRKRVLG
jgi:recombination protein RecA